MAPRCPRAGTHGRVDDPSRSDAEDGCLWVPEGRSNRIPSINRRVHPPIGIPRNGQPSLRCMGLHGAVEPQADGRILLGFAHGADLPRNSYDAAIGNRRSALHDVRSWDHQPPPVRCRRVIQAPLPHPGDRIDARNRPPQPMAGGAHDARLDGQPRTPTDGRVRGGGRGADRLLDDFRLARPAPGPHSRDHRSLLPDLDAADDLRVQ